MFNITLSDLPSTTECSELLDVDVSETKFNEWFLDQVLTNIGIVGGSIQLHDMILMMDDGEEADLEEFIKTYVI